MEKSLGKGDVILPITQFNHKPFVIDIYLAKKSFNPTKLLSPKVARSVLCFWENIPQLIIFTYQTEETRQKGVFPPNEYWVFKK